MKILRYWMLCVVVLLIAGCGINPQARNNQGNRFLEQGALICPCGHISLRRLRSRTHLRRTLITGWRFWQSRTTHGRRPRLQQALLTADATLTEDIYFALGEVYFRQGQYAQAVDMYRQVLLRRDDEDARHNLELALSLIPTPTEPPLPTPTQGEGQDQEPSTPTNDPDTDATIPGR